jgi:hypothetical protein
LVLPGLARGACPQRQKHGQSDLKIGSAYPGSKASGRLTDGDEDPTLGPMSGRPQFDQFEVSELYCPRCRAARPVRRHLLLVLPTGNKYEYRCSACGTSVGAKDDGDPSEFHSILRGT